MDFKCKMCGACCRIKDGIVRVSDEEIGRIARFMNLDEQALIDSYTEISPDRRGLVLKSRSDGACIFLNEENLCAINEVKPEKCGTFPFEWVNDDSFEVCPALRERNVGFF